LEVVAHASFHCSIFNVSVDIFVEMFRLILYHLENRNKSLFSGELDRNNHISDASKDDWSQQWDVCSNLVIVETCNSADNHERETSSVVRTTDGSLDGCGKSFKDGLGSLERLRMGLG